MPEQGNRGDGTDRADREYDDLVWLDELETLLEDLEDELSSASSSNSISEDLQHRMDGAGVKSAADLRNLIADLHRRLDRND